MNRLAKPPSSAAASFCEDKANSYNYERYPCVPKSSAAAPRVGDGDAQHRYRHEDYQDEGNTSMSQINSYVESDKTEL